jgi:hypothetical protein
VQIRMELHAQPIPIAFQHRLVSCARYLVHDGRILIGDELGWQRGHQ